MGLAAGLSDGGRQLRGPAEFARQTIRPREEAGAGCRSPSGKASGPPQEIGCLRRSETIERDVFSDFLASGVVWVLASGLSGMAGVEWSEPCALIHVGRALSPSSVFRKIEQSVAFQFHRIVQHATNLDGAAAFDAIEHEMPGPADSALGCAHTLSAVTEVIASDAAAQFRPRHASGAVGLSRKICQCRNEQCFVACPYNIPEALGAPDQQAENISLCRRGKAQASHG